MYFLAAFDYIKLSKLNKATGFQVYGSAGQVSYKYWVLDFFEKYNLKQKGTLPRNGS